MMSGVNRAAVIERHDVLGAVNLGETMSACDVSDGF
jgi:hypothetical protein